MMVYMKKHISVFQLMVRCNFYRVWAVLAIMIVLQTGLFLFALNRGFGIEGFGLEHVFEKSYIEIVFFGAFIAMDLLLRAGSGYEMEGKHRYTMMRLSVTRKEVYYWHFVSNVLYYLLFLTVQILIIVILGMVYMNVVPAEYITGQTLFLACYRYDLLHSLLPLGDYPYLIRNILILAAASLYSAYYPKESDLKQGENAGKKKGNYRFNLFVFFPVLFIGEFGDYFYCNLAVVFGAVYILWKISRIRNEEIESRQEEQTEEVSA